jgi:putative (di)nucleoside polyphosphate hydrolase
MTSPPQEALPYRPCVGIALFNPAGLVFVGHRISSDEDTHWQMPQGGIDRGESPQAAALRELGEEVGTARARIIGEVGEWLTYDLPRNLLGRSLRGSYRGQRQKWFAMRFEGRDTDIDLNTDHPEFNDWKWVPLPQVVNFIIAFKRPVYERVVAEFARLAVPGE